MTLKRPPSAKGGSALGSELVRNIIKDMRVEFRSRSALGVALVFAAVTTLAVSMVSGGVPFEPKIQAILLWLIMYFSAMNGLAHGFTREADQGTELFLRIHSDPDAVYLSKLIFNISLFMLVQCIVTPVFAVLMQVDVKDTVHLVLTVAAGGLATASAVTLLAAMVAKAGGRGPLFTVISLPLVLPVLWVSITATGRAISGTAAQGSRDLLFLLAFSGMVIAISFILFRFVWLDE